MNLHNIIEDMKNELNKMKEPKKVKKNWEAINSKLNVSLNDVFEVKKSSQKILRQGMNVFKGEKYKVQKGFLSNFEDKQNGHSIDLELISKEDFIKLFKNLKQ